jgi:hypothetical protein
MLHAASFAAICSRDHAELVGYNMLHARLRPVEDGTPARIRHSGALYASAKNGVLLPAQWQQDAAGNHDEDHGLGRVDTRRPQNRDERIADHDRVPV